MEVKELQERFLKFEIDHGAFDQKIFGNFHYWDVIRQEAYEALLGYYGLYFVTPVVPDKKLGWKLRLRFLWNVVENEFVFLFRKKRRKIVFFSVSRNIDGNGFANDDLNQDYRNQLSDKEYIELEGWYYAPYNPATKYKTRYFTYVMWLMRRMAGRIRKRVPDEVTRFIDEFEQYFGVHNIFAREAAIMQIVNFYIDVRYFKWILKRIKPQFVIVSGCERYIALACNELGIDSVELQHGTFSKMFNLRYEYDDSAWSKNIKTIFPYFFTFSDYWTQLAALPTKIVALGNSYLYNEVIPVRKEARNVLIITNQDFTPIFLEPMKKLSIELPEFIFYFKLHSAEYEYMDSVVRFFEGCSNVRVILNEKNVNDLLQVCNLMMTIQSTVAYQAIQQKVPVVVLKEKYYWISEDIFSTPNVYLVNSWDEFRDLLQKGDIQYTEANQVRFFDPFNPEAFRNFLKHEEGMNKIVMSKQALSPPIQKV